ncbi:MAG TPA: hypothetical protein ENH10_07700 [Bacteroidetes bacterium]|nr:hypothetical protein [Bacteroidota bacterium]HEX05021.1 hypothetical protein [Bacteroidota bacterium]
MNNGTRFTLGVVSLILGVLFATIFVNRLQAEEPMDSKPDTSVEQSYMDSNFQTTNSPGISWSA